MLQPIANRGQNTNNTLKVYTSNDVCCSGLPGECQFDIVIPTANAVNNVIFKRTAADAPVTKTFPAPVTGMANVLAALNTALTAEGYEDDGDTPVGITAYTDGTNTVYQITGSLIVVSMLHNTNTTVAATQKCTRIARCTYKANWAGGNAKTFTANGTATVLGDLTFNTATAAQVDTALSALVPAGSVVAVVKNGTTNLFEITIYSGANQEFNIDSVDFVASNCGPGYVA